MKKDRSAEQDRKQLHPGLPLFVVFTTVQDTLLSLQAVDRFTSDLSLRIHLLVPDRAEYSASRITPVMLADFTARYFLTMVPHTSDWQIKLTRYPAATEDLWEVLPPQSLIILAGTTRRFWSSPEQRFARQLRQAGHEVIFFSTQSLDADRSLRSEAKSKPSKKKSSFDFLKLLSLRSLVSHSRT
jgi:acetyl esterase/lipase